MVFALSLLTLVSACAATNLPIVDLGYELHRASSLDTTLGTYNFSNIRYAAPPLGDLRFRAPVWPAKNRTHVQDGSVGRICPQAEPLWEKYLEPAFLQSLTTGTKFNQSTNISLYPYVPEKMDPRTSEDCLFLDVVVPKQIFDRARNRSSVSRKSLAPVLVWIYGGGYVTGDKSFYDPSGLIERSMANGDGMVYVAMNYRLGAFGWLSGDAVIENGTPNAALHDQRLALDWVHKNIRLFGGDATRVTVMGESAGGGSIMHQITAYGGKADPAPFQQAIVQSPGWVPVASKGLQEKTLRQFLHALNVQTIEDARQVPTDKLIAGNAYQVATEASWGDFIYGPVVDGSFVPALPGHLLLQGRFVHDVNLMVGHNANEGLIFLPPAARNPSWIVDLVKGYYPSIQSNVTDYITQVLYPPVYDGSLGYKSAFERADFLLSELTILCNTDYLNRAYQNQTYAYEFSIPPGVHGQDTLYTFYNNGSSGVEVPHYGISVTNVTVTDAMQDYFTSFVQTGMPSSSRGPAFRRHGYRGQLMNIGNYTIAPMRDPTDNPRCRFWQTAPYAW